MTKLCLYCGEPFDPAPQHAYQLYCKPQCGKSHRYRLNLPQRPRYGETHCIVCGVPIDNPRNTHKKFCSHRCQCAHQYQKIKAARPQRIYCAHCGKSIDNPHPQQRFCCDRCRRHDQWQREKMKPGNRVQWEYRKLPKRYRETVGSRRPPPVVLQGVIVSIDGYWAKVRCCGLTHMVTVQKLKRLDAI